MLYKTKTWQDELGYYHCNCVDNIVGMSSHWIHGARISGLAPAAYIKYVINNFSPIVRFNKQKCLIFFKWDNQTNLNKYKTWINKLAKEKNYQI